MTPTRRQTLLFAAAALAGAALPHGHTPAALAAETSPVDVLEADEAEQEVIARQKWFLTSFREWERGGGAGVVYVEHLSDGSARLVFQSPISGNHGPDRFAADPSAEQIIVPLDAATFGRLHHAMWAMPA